MFSDLKTERVRLGEWNEALCFFIDYHPLTEIAVQKCNDHWNIFYISSKKIRVLRSNIQKQEIAENEGKILADRILRYDKPGIYV